MGSDMRVWATTAHDVDSLSTAPLGHAKSVKQHRGRPSPGENDASERRGNPRAGVAAFNFLKKRLFKNEPIECGTGLPKWHVIK